MTEQARLILKKASEAASEARARELILTKRGVNEPTTTT